MSASGQTQLLANVRFWPIAAAHRLPLNWISSRGASQEQTDATAAAQIGKVNQPEHYLLPLASAMT